MTTLPSDFSELEGFNRTELYQCVKRKGINVPPGMSREGLIHLLLGLPDTEVSEDLTYFDESRLKIMSMVREYAENILTQIHCPAKSLDPYACFGCLDMQVLSCLEKNGPDMEKLITAQQIVRRRPPT